LPGGIGTLEEVSEIMVERGLAMHSKPLVLVNQDGYYDGLLAFLDRMIAENFKSAGFKSLIGVANTVDEVWPLLESPADFQADQLWQPRA
ncbi:MAG: LOG family protein, partial [Verrucomicrobiia bacterium]